MATRIGLINKALARLGEFPLEFADDDDRAAFGDPNVTYYEDDRAEMASLIYPEVRTTLLNAHPWSWLAERASLVKRERQADETAEDEAAWPFPNRYRLRNQHIGAVRAVFESGRVSQPRADAWTIQGGWLYADFEVAFVEYQRQISEEAFPDLFANAMIMALCAEFAMPIKDDLPTQARFRQLAELALNDAKRVDGQGHPIQVLPVFEWEEARLAGTGLLRRGT